MFHNQRHPQAMGVPEIEAILGHRAVTPEQKAIVSTCTDTWKLCLGAIVGLISGRNLPASNPDDPNEDT